MGIDNEWFENRSVDDTLTIVAQAGNFQKKLPVFFVKSKKFFLVVQQNQFLPCHYPGKGLEPVFNFTLLYK
jgi:hypothetical protein